MANWCKLELWTILFQVRGNNATVKYRTWCWLIYLQIWLSCWYISLSSVSFPCLSPLGWMIVVLSFTLVRSRMPIASVLVTLVESFRRILNDWLMQSLTCARRWKRPHLHQRLLSFKPLRQRNRGGSEWETCAIWARGFIETSSLTLHLYNRINSTYFWTASPNSFAGVLWSSCVLLIRRQRRVPSFLSVLLRPHVCWRGLVECCGWVGCSRRGAAVASLQKPGTPQLVSDRPHDCDRTITQ